MINNCTRIVSNWVRNHPKYGFLQMLEQVPGYALAQVSYKWDIFDDVADAEITNELNGCPTYPAILLVADAPAVIEDFKTGRSAQEIDPIAMAAFFLTEGMPWKESVEHTGYAMRAMVASFTAFADPRLNPVSSEYRRDDGVTFVQLEALAQERVVGAVGKSRCSGIVVGSMQFKDTFFPFPVQ